MDQREMIMGALRQVAQLCAIAAVTAPKSGGQLFLKGSKPFIETVVVEDRETFRRLADWMRQRGKITKEANWYRDADTAERTDLVLFVGLAKWYPPVYDCGACGYGTCAEFLQARTKYYAERSSTEWEFAGPICQLRCVDLGIAVGSAAKVASANNIDVRCQTRIAGAARHLKLVDSDLAVALSMSVSHKNIFFDRKPAQMPEEK